MPRREVYQNETARFRCPEGHGQAYRVNGISRGGIQCDDCAAVHYNVIPEHNHAVVRSPMGSHINTLNRHREINCFYCGTCNLYACEFTSWATTGGRGTLNEVTEVAFERVEPVMTAIKKPKDKLVGIELEYDPNNNPIAQHILDGGADYGVGTDAGGSTTIEVRTDPIEAHNIKGFATHLADLMDELLTNQPPDIFAGCGIRYPIGMHIHVDSEGKQETLDHFTPLWTELIGQSATNYLARRLDNGYGAVGNVRQQPFEGEEDRQYDRENPDKKWWEYRGLPTPVTPEAMGFIFGWSSLLPSRKAAPTITRLRRIREFIKFHNTYNGSEFAEDQPIHKHWGVDCQHVCSGDGSLGTSIAPMTEHLKKMGWGHIKASKLRRERRYRWVYVTPTTISWEIPEGKIYTEPCTSQKAHDTFKESGFIGAYSHPYFIVGARYESQAQEFFRRALYAHHGKRVLTGHRCGSFMGRTRQRIMKGYYKCVG